MAHVLGAEALHLNFGTGADRPEVNDWIWPDAREESATTTTTDVKINRCIDELLPIAYRSAAGHRVYWR